MLEHAHGTMPKHAHGTAPTYSYTTHSYMQHVSINNIHMHSQITHRWRQGVAVGYRKVQQSTMLG